MARWERHLVGLLVGLGACSSSGASRADRGTSTTRDSAESSTTPSRPTTTSTNALPLPYSFDGSVAAPALHNTGSNYTAVAESLLAYGDWVDAHDPDIKLVPRFAAPSSKTNSAARHDISILTKLNRRLFETNRGPDRATVVDAHSRDAVTLRVQQQLVCQTVVDRAGHVTSKRDFSATTTYIVLIARSTDGRWLLADIEEQGAK